MFTARKSGDSSYSGQSYFSNPVWNANFTSLYWISEYIDAFDINYSLY